MKNWIHTHEGNLINLDFIQQIRVMQHEDKWYVVGDLNATGQAYLISKPCDSQVDATNRLEALWNNWIK